MLDAETRKQILTAYATGATQTAVAPALKLPVALVADVLDGKL